MATGSPSFLSSTVRAVSGARAATPRAPPRFSARPTSSLVSLSGHDRRENRRPHRAIGERAATFPTATVYAQLVQGDILGFFHGHGIGHDIFDIGPVEVGALNLLCVLGGPVHLSTNQIQVDLRRR